MTVVVPCFNEGEGVRRLHTEVTAALSPIADLELLLVDDGSTDDTLAQIRSLAAADHRVRYLSLSRNGGIEAAQSAGFRYASQPWTAQLDCDLQVPPSELPKLLAKAAEGYDVVFGIREQRQDPLWRRWGSSGQHWLARRGFGIDLPVGASTIRVVRTAAARTIAEMRQGTPYFIATVPQLGLRYASVPVAHRRRADGGSRFRVARLFGHSFELLFGHSWRPLNGSYLVAAGGVLAAVVLAVLGLVGVAGPTALGIAAVLLAAVTLASVALVGRYLHRLMRDAQRTRPYYIREANLPLRPEDRLDGGEDWLPPPLVTSDHGDRRPDLGPLLVLGASDDQLPVYREARRRGVRTIAVDRRSDLPALRYADEHLPVSIRDPAGIAEALGERRPAGVLAAGGELGIWSWHELSERYRTPYRYPRRAATASTDKAAFHAVAARAGVNTYRWRHGTDQAALVAQAGEVGFPLVVKPADGSGRKGVALVREPAQLAGALARAAGFSTGGDLVIEQLLTGRDLTVDVFLRAGEVAFAAVHEKLTDPADGFRTRSQVTPAPLDRDTNRRLVETAARLCREIGLAEGPADFDVILGAGGDIQVLEVNARLPGEAVPMLIREVYGVDLVAAVVSLALGEPVEVGQRRSAAGILHLIGSPLTTVGTLRAVSGADLVREMPGVARCELYVEPGATVPPYPQLGYVIGYLVVVEDDPATAEATLATALKVLDVEIQEGAPSVP